MANEKIFRVFFGNLPERLFNDVTAALVTLCSRNGSVNRD